MLRNVIDAYLDTVTERQFDLPFIALLPNLGFYDIHYTHGQTEFGKDFIAKKDNNGTIVQYSFQCKAGNISQSEWRNDIQGQMLEAVITTLSHPNFDINLPHQVILVTTGNFKGNAALALQNLNKTITNTYQKMAIEFWGKQHLLDLLELYGFEGIYHHENSNDIVNYGRFFTFYGRILQENISYKEIEEYSARWYRNNFDVTKKCLIMSIESEILSSSLINKKFHYEAIQLLLGSLRFITTILFDNPNDYIKELHDRILDRLYNLCNNLYNSIIKIWIDNNKSFDKSYNELTIISYPVQCSRILDILSILILLEKDIPKKNNIINFMEDFLRNEQGCYHIISDNYAVSIIIPIITLIKIGKIDLSIDIVKKVLIWLCDRFEQGYGIAPFDSTEKQEIETLIGYTFSFIDIYKNPNSLLSTILIDLAAYIGDQQFYSDVVNDIIACNIARSYWQVQDTIDQFFVDGDDVISYPNINYEDSINGFSNYQFGEHIKEEIRNFKLIEKYQITSSYFLIMLLLRDRYYPSLWLDIDSK